MTPSSQPTVTPAGEVVFEGDSATLRFERFLPHPVEAVWAALTDPAQLASWFMTQATIDGRPGGSLRMVSGPARFEWTGKYLTWEPPHVLEYEWNLEPRKEMPSGEASLVRWELAREGQGTKLTLTHRRLTKGTALGFAPGTHAFLDRLAAQLAGESLPNWMQRFDDVKHAYPSWEARA